MYFAMRKLAPWCHPAPLLLIGLTILGLSACATRTTELSPPEESTERTELFVMYGDIGHWYYMSYTSDKEAIIIRKSVPTGSGDLRSHVKVVAEQRIPCSPQSARNFNRTVSGLDLRGHAESLKRLKDRADGPYYTLYNEGKVEAEGWTPEFDELYIHVLNTIVMRQFENATK